MKTNVDKSLKRLSTEANKQHELGSAKVKEGMQLIVEGLHCFKASGESLRKIKKRLGHGEWQPWLKKNFSGSFESAQLYMRIAREWHSRLAAAVESGDVCSLRDARKFLSGPTESASKPIKQFTLNNILFPLELVRPGLSMRGIVEH